MTALIRVGESKNDEEDVLRYPRTLYCQPSTTTIIDKSLAPTRSNNASRTTVLAA